MTPNTSYIMKRIKVKSRNARKGKNAYRVVKVEANQAKEPKVKPAQVIVVELKQPSKENTSQLTWPDVVKSVLTGVSGGIASATTNILFS
jgi:hypothetical protein